MNRTAAAIATDLSPGDRRSTQRRDVVAALAWSQVQTAGAAAGQPGLTARVAK